MRSIAQIPFVFCFSFISGIALGSWIEISNKIILYALAPSLLFILAYLFQRKPLLTLTGVFILGVCFGVFMINRASIQLKEARTLGNFSKEVKLYAKVVSEKQTRENYSSYVIQDMAERQDKILLLTAKHSNYNYGDILSIEGNLEVPKQFSDFDYQGYLAKGGIYWTTAFPEVKLSKNAEESLQNSFFKGLYGLRSKIRQKIVKSFPKREAGFLRAIILGDQGTIEEDLRQELSRSGTSHIVAISGLHLSILAIFLFGLLLLLGLWRKQATIITIIVLIAFLAFIGFKASLARAVFMASLAFLALASGQLFQGERVLSYGAFLMLVFRPLLLRYDTGFQLSFLAVLGIFLLKPLFDHLFTRAKIPQSLRDLLTVTLAAQIFTLPIVIYNFRIVSLIAPLANFVILLILPLILGLGFLWAFLSIFISVFWLPVVIYPLISAILKFISWLSQFGFSAKELDNNLQLSIFNLIYYLLLMTLVIFWRKYSKRKLTPLAEWQIWKNQ